MTIEPLVSQEVKAADKFLWAVRTYLDLITRDDQLVFGSGLKRLYAMSSGVGTLNDTDIEAIAEKSDRLKLSSGNIHGFMIKSILKNIELYAKELRGVIAERVIGVSNGDVRNPTAIYKGNPDEARRFYYTPPPSFITRLQKALLDDTPFPEFRSSGPQVVTLQDVANDAEFVLMQMQLQEGHMTPMESTWGALVTCVERLVEITESEARYAVDRQDYKARARPSLKILWFIAKCVMGDLTTSPVRRDRNLIDLDKTLNLSDGTLASIPFPQRETVTLFSDDDGRGISMKGRTYLAALSAASFYRNDKIAD